MISVSDTFQQFWHNGFGEYRGFERNNLISVPEIVAPHDWMIALDVFHPAP
jgi:hypothetical protein